MLAPETAAVTPRLAFEFNVFDAGVTVTEGVSRTIVVTVTAAVLLAGAYTESPAYLAVSVLLGAPSEFAGMVKVTLPLLESVPGAE
jgi:hypothetical protein